MYDLVIKNGHVLTGQGEFIGDVAITGEKIGALGANLSHNHILAKLFSVRASPINKDACA